MEVQPHIEDRFQLIINNVLVDSASSQSLMQSVFDNHVNHYDGKKKWFEAELTREEWLQSRADVLGLDSCLGKVVLFDRVGRITIAEAHVSK